MTLNLNITGNSFKYLLAIAIVALFSCSMKKTAKAVFKQGIEGTVYKVSGNQMPMKGAERSKPKALVCEVYIYEATKASQAQGNGTLYSLLNTKMVAKTKTDSSGRYQVTLPAGTYSVFVKEGNQYFASESDGTGILNPALVTTGNITTRNITVNHDAAY